MTPFKALCQKCFKSNVDCTVDNRKDRGTGMTLCAKCMEALKNTNG